MPFQTEKFLVGAEGSLSTSGNYTFDVPQFDPSLGTLTGATIALISTFEATVDINDTTGNLSSANTSVSVSTTYSASDPSGPTFDTTTINASDSEFSLLFYSNEASLALEGTGYEGAVTLDNTDRAIGTGTYQIEASYAPTITSNASTSLVSDSFSYGLEVSYTYLPEGEAGGAGSTLIPERTGDELNGPGDTQKLFVTSFIPTIAPVTPADPLDYAFSIEQFDPIYGTLEEANITFYGSIISTAFLNELFPTGFGTVGSGTAAVAAVFGDTPGGPTMPDTEMAITAYNTAYVLGIAAMPLNATGQSQTVSLGNIQAAVGEGTYDIASSYTGSFLGYPFATLPQQAFVYGVEVEYIFTPGAGGRPIILSSANDNRTGTNGSDFFDGQAGNDRLIGGGGNDTLIGGAGRDFLGGGAGADFMRGGLDNDQYVVDSTGDQIDSEIGYSLGGGVDTVRSFISYTLPRNVEILRLQGDGNINGSGNWAPESLVGNTGNNRLNGSGGTDQLNGKAGNDVLIGGAGADTMVGDTGADIFRFNAVSDSRAGSASRDFINGFTHGQDRINLFEIDANTNVAGNQAFTFVGNSQFSGSAGEVRFFTFGGGNYNIVEADTNGDGTADMQVFVNLTNFMVASDFIL